MLLLCSCSALLMLLLTTNQLATGCVPAGRRGERGPVAATQLAFSVNHRGKRAATVVPEPLAPVSAAVGAAGSSSETEVAPFPGSA